MDKKSEECLGRRKLLPQGDDNLVRGSIVRKLDPSENFSNLKLFFWEQKYNFKKVKSYAVDKTLYYLIR